METTAKNQYFILTDLKTGKKQQLLGSTIAEYFADDMDLDSDVPVDKFLSDFGLQIQTWCSPRGIEDLFSLTIHNQYSIRFSCNGQVIDDFCFLVDAEEKIREYEKQDKKDGNFEQNSYEIYDNMESQIVTI